MLVSSPLALAFPSISHYLLASLMLSTLREYFPLIRLPSPSFDAITVLIGSCNSDVWKSRGLSCEILAYYTDRGALEKDKGFVGHICCNSNCLPYEVLNELISKSYFRTKIYK